MREWLGETTGSEFNRERLIWPIEEWDGRIFGEKILTAHFSLYVHYSLYFFQFAKVLAEEMEES